MIREERKLPTEQPGRARPLVLPANVKPPGAYFHAPARALTADPRTDAPRLRSVEVVSTLPRIDIPQPTIQSAIQSANYVSWANWAKGIGIILVVYGHAWRGLNPDTRAHSPLFFNVLDPAIYGMHMPLFFFLSGLFVERSAQHPAGLFLAKKLKTIVYPYFLWTAIQAGIACLLRNYTHSNKETVFTSIMLHSPYEPYAQFWFLYVLAACMVIFLVLYKLGIRPVWIFLLATAFISLGLLKVPLGSLGVVYEVQNNLIYFTAGAAISSIVLAAAARARKEFLAVAALSGFALAFAPAMLQWHSSPSVNILVAALGIFGCVAFSALLARNRTLPFLEYLGKQSMVIYVAHVIFAAGARTLLSKLTYEPLPTNLSLGIMLAGCTCAGLLLPLALAALADRLRIRTLLGLP